MLKWMEWMLCFKETWNTTLSESTQTDTPCHPGDLWPHDPISGMSPKDRLAKMISIPDSYLSVSRAGLALGKSSHKSGFPKSTIDKGALESFMASQSSSQITSHLLTLRVLDTDWWRILDSSDFYTILKLSNYNKKLLCCKYSCFKYLDSIGFTMTNIKWFRKDYDRIWQIKEMKYFWYIPYNT